MQRILLELSNKKIPKRIYGTKNALNVYWNVKAKFQFLSNSYMVFDNSRISFKLLIVLQRKSITEKLFLCMLKINFKTVETSSNFPLKSVAAKWGGGSKLLPATKIFKTIKILR